MGRQRSHLKEFQVHIKRDMFFHVMSHLLFQQSKSTQLGQIIESSPSVWARKRKPDWFMHWNVYNHWIVPIKLEQKARIQLKCTLTKYYSTQ